MGGFGFSFVLFLELHIVTLFEVTSGDSFILRKLLVSQLVFGKYWDILWTRQVFNL